MRTIVEVKDEGLDGLMNKRVLIMSAGYFYEGVLVGINDTCIKLTDCYVVYATGKWGDEKYLDIQKMHTLDWYVNLGLIESFGLSKND